MPQQLLSKQAAGCHSSGLLFAAVCCCLLLLQRLLPMFTCCLLTMFALLPILFVVVTLPCRLSVLRSLARAPSTPSAPRNWLPVPRRLRGVAREAEEGTRTTSYMDQKALAHDAPITCSRLSLIYYHGRLHVVKFRVVVVTTISL